MFRFRIYFIFALFISAFGAPMLVLENPIIQGGIAYCGTRPADCSRSIQSILTNIHHAREAYSTDFNYRQMELLKMNEQATKFQDQNRGKNIPFVN